MNALCNKRYRDLALFLITFFLGTTGQAFAQNRENIKFSHLNRQDGLSQSTVNTILQDYKGFMWFGTHDGLNRYNGYEVTVYKANPKDSTSLGSSDITTLFEDSHKNLWVGTSGNGLNRYNRNQDNFIQIKVNRDNLAAGISNNSITSMLEDDKGKIWIGTSEGLNWYLPEEDRYVQIYSDTHYPDSTNTKMLSGNNIKALAKDKLGHIWVGTEHGLNRWNPKTKTFTRFLHNPSNPHSLSNNIIWDIYKDRNGTLWIGTKGGGLDYYNQDENRFYHFTHNANDPHSISGDSVFDILEDNKGILWVCETKGLNAFDPKEKKFYHYQHREGDPSSLTNNSIHSIYESNDNILWIGTFAGGVNYTDRKYSMFEHYNHEPTKKNTLSTNSVLSFLRDSKNNFWIGTDGGGLNIFDLKHKSFQALRHQSGNHNSLSSDVILDMANAEKGYIWLGYYNGGISKFDPETNAFTNYKHIDGDTTSLSNDDVFVLHKDRKGKLWIGTNGGGLNLFQPRSGTFKRYSTWKYIRSLYDDADGYLWIGTYGVGLIRLDPKTGRTKQYSIANSKIQSDVILAIHKAGKGKLWLGTNGGLIKFDKKRQSFLQYTTGDGLPSMVINGILEDKKENLWLSTNNGLSKFIPKTGKFKNFGINDGLQEIEFNPMAYYKDKQGFMYFGGINGFNRFHPDSIKTDSSSYPLVFTDFKILNKSVSPGPDSPLNKQISQTNEIALPHTASVLTFKYASLDFNSIKGDQYAFKLEGFDTDWNYVGSKRTATYTNLNPGEYTLKVKSANMGGVWNNKAASLIIKIKPPYWQTTWFYIAVGMLVAGIVITAYRWRVRNIKRHNKRLEKEVENRTSELNEKNNDLKQALRDLKDTRGELIEKAHKAGMADLATGVLHNIGNILNSVNISTTVIEETLVDSKIPKLKQANNLLSKHQDNLKSFLLQDPRGMKLMDYYLKLEDPLDREYEQLKVHCDRLNQKVRLMIEVIDAQQDFSKVGRIVENVQLERMVEDTLTLQAGSIERHSLDICTEFGQTDNVKVQKSKLIHILINLFKNAKEAMSDVRPGKKKITIRTYQNTEAVYLSVSDSGHGISPEHQQKIFTHGFTTKQDGHGYGLHTCANYMTEMGGKITAESEGVGQGTTFTLIFTKKGLNNKNNNHPGSATTSDRLDDKQPLNS